MKVEGMHRKERCPDCGKVMRRTAIPDHAKRMHGKEPSISGERILEVSKRLDVFLTIARAGVPFSDEEYREIGALCDEIGADWSRLVAELDVLKLD